MSSRRDNLKDDDSHDEQNRRPARRKKKAPHTTAPPFAANEAPVEEMITDSSPSHIPLKGKKQKYDDTESTEALSASRLRIQFEETKEEQHHATIAHDAAWSFQNAVYERRSFPGAESVGGDLRVGTGHAICDSTYDEDPMGDDEEEDEAPIVANDATSMNVVALAQLVDDPIEAAEVWADRSGELELRLSQVKRRRRQLWIGFGIGFIVVVVIIAGLISSLLRRESGSGSSSGGTTAPSAVPTPNPTTTEPTPNPTTTMAPSPTPTTLLQASWIRLIQSRMPSTTFDDFTSPEGKALDWLVDDSYSRTLDDDDRIVQRFALAVLYYSTNGLTSWTLDGGEWLLSSSECDWGEESSVECMDDDLVISLDLESAGLLGTIPRDIGLLPGLTLLRLWGNNLKGTIPTEIGLLLSMTWLALYDNGLEGTIPSEIGLLSDLRVLALRNNNKLSGLVPSELGNLSSLKTLTLEFTNLSGSIPSSLCGSSSLTQAWIDCGEIECDCCTAFGGDVAC